MRLPKLLKAAAVLVMIGAALSLVSHLPNSRYAYAQELLSIVVTVVNGTPDAAVPSDLQVVLHIIQIPEETEVESRALTADEHGTVRFSDVPVGPDLRYIVATEYRGGTYFAQAFPGDSQEPVTLSISIFEDTLSTDSLSVVDDVLLISGEDSQSRVLSVFEIVQLNNDGVRTFVPDLSQAEAGVMSFLRFYLPQNATNLRVESDLIGGQYLPVDSGFALVTPVPPGSYQVMFTYQVPYKGDSVAFSPSFPFGAERLRILMPQELGNIQSEAMERLEPAQRGDTLYHVLEAKVLPRGASLEIELEGLPQPPLIQRVKEAVTEGRVLSVGIPVMSGFALLSLLIYSYRRKRARLRDAPSLIPVGDGQGLEEERRSLMEAIAQLDDQFGGGNIPKEEYQERRAQLKARLMEEEHRHRG